MGLGVGSGRACSLRVAEDGRVGGVGKRRDDFLLRAVVCVDRVLHGGRWVESGVKREVGLGEQSLTVYLDRGRAISSLRPRLVFSYWEAVGNRFGGVNGVV